MNMIVVINEEVCLQQEMAMRQLQEERRGHQADNTAPMQPPPAPPLGGRPDVSSLLYITLILS